ncbi:protein tumorous imaginal discs, mitochondrial isoform X3 [Folsomia candida]|nr:protein tumorous imaginal discs, mitochondrial isoform X3 [Folsomia candida]
MASTVSGKLLVSRKALEGLLLRPSNQVIRSRGASSRGYHTLIRPNHNRCHPLSSIKTSKTTAAESSLSKISVDFSIQLKRSIHVSSNLSQRKDYYQILGIPKNAATKEVKNAYYKLAKQYHPDTNKDSNAKLKFQDVSEAYEVLSDDTKRREYDAWGRTSEQMGREGYGGGRGFGSGAQGGGPQWQYQSSVDPEELFRKIFGEFRDPRFGGNPFGQGFGNFGGGGEEDEAFGFGGAQEQILMNLTFEEAARGCLKDTKVNVTETCPKCEGTKAAPGSKTQKCTSCNGTGMETIATGPFVMRSTCRRCKGTRQIITNPCGNCRGTGNVVNRKTVTVPVPAGIEDSQTVRMPVGKKEVFITFRVEKSDYFTRDGIDVHTDTSISFCQAALGGSTRIKGVHENFDLDIPPGTSSHTRMRLRGKGIKRVNGFGHGDHYVHIKIKIPTGLTPEQEALIRAFAEYETNTPGTIKGVTKTKSGQSTNAGSETEGKGGAGEFLKKIKDAILGMNNGHEPPARS